MLLIYRGHQRGCGGQHLVDEDKNGLLGRELDALANDIYKLTDGEVGRHQVLLLVDGRNV